MRTLTLQVYYHGETIKVHVSVTNSSSKNIKNIIVSGKRDRPCGACCCVSDEALTPPRVSVSPSVDQISNVVLYSNDSYVKCVAIEETGCVSTRDIQFG